MRSKALRTPSVVILIAFPLRLVALCENLAKRTFRLDGYILFSPVGRDQRNLNPTTRGSILSTEHLKETTIEPSDTAHDTSAKAHLVSDASADAPALPDAGANKVVANQMAADDAAVNHASKKRKRRSFTSGLLLCAILLSATCAWIDHLIGPRSVSMTPIETYLEMTPQSELAVLMNLKLKQARENFVNPDYKSNQANAIFVDLGNFYLAKGDEATAVRYFEECLSQYQRSRSPDTYYFGEDYCLDTATDTLCEIYVSQGRYEDAKRVFESRYRGWPVTEFAGQQKLKPALDLWLAPTFERAALFYGKLGDKPRSDQMRKLAEQCRLMPDDLMLERNYISDVTTRYTPKDAIKTLYLTARRCTALGEYDRAKRLFRIASDSSLYESSNADSQINIFETQGVDVSAEKKTIALRAQMMEPVVSMLAGDYASAEKEFPAAFRAWKQIRAPFIFIAITSL